RHHHADDAAAQHVAPQAHHAEVRLTRECRRLIVARDIERSDVPLARLSGNAATGDDWDGTVDTQADASAVEDGRVVGTASAPEAECSAPLEEELPLLRIRQVEARQVDLRFVVLDLREVC